MDNKEASKYFVFKEKFLVNFHSRVLKFEQRKNKYQCDGHLKEGRTIASKYINTMEWALDSNVQT